MTVSRAIPKTYKPAELQEVLRVLNDEVLLDLVNAAHVVKALHDRGYRIVHVGCVKRGLTR